MNEPRRVLILVPKHSADGRDARIASGHEPRVEYQELARRLGADVRDLRSVSVAESRAVRWIGRVLGPVCGLLALGFLARREYDVIYATGEDISIALGIMLRLAGSHQLLTTVIHKADGAKKRVALQLVGERVYRNVVTLCEEQRRTLIRTIGIPDAKIRCIPIWCDHQFFRDELPRPGDYVLSVGMERRDYPTLQAVAARLPFPVRVVASGWWSGSGFQSADGILPTSNVSVERNVSALRLRELYQGARMVVVPLQSVRYAAGVTTIVEAMAMGKPVVVSDTPGIVDYVRDGLSGRLVPAGDANALRRAIVELWENPDLAATMGAYNRAWVESEINLDAYVERATQLLNADSQPASSSQAKSLQLHVETR